MKNLPQSLIAGCCFILAAAGCADLDFITDEDQLKNEYAVNWIKRYGLIDPKQDWIMASPVQATVDPSCFGSGYTVRIYSKKPSEGGALIAETDKPATMTLDVNKGATSVYVRAYAPVGGTYEEGIYPIADGALEITARSRASQSPMRIPITDETVNPYNWIVACEDLGSTADCDFNDIVLGLTYTAGSNTMDITALAAGGIFKAEVWFGESKLYEIHEALHTPVQTNGYSQMVNTTCTSWKPSMAGETSTVTPTSFSVPVSDDNFSLRNALSQLKIKVYQNGESVDAIEINGFDSTQEEGSSNTPQMLCLPGDWEWPVERTDISTAYPGFKSWVNDASVTDWISTAVSRQIVQREKTAPIVSGEFNKTVTVNGVERSFIMYVPTGVKTNSPLVFSLHGANNNATDYMPFTKARADAEPEHPIVVYPQGLIQHFNMGDRTGWNATGENNEEIAFFKEIIKEVKKSYSIDENRIYCCGFSNGGMMTYAAADAASDIFAAFASVAGYQLNEFHLRATGARPVPFVHVHGKADDFVEWEHTPVIRDTWAARNGCSLKPTVTDISNRWWDNGTNSLKTGTTSKKYVYSPVNADGVQYVFYELEGLGHYYTGNDIQEPNTTDYVSIDKVFWDFLKQYRLNDRREETLKWRINIDDTTDPMNHGWTHHQGHVLYYGTTTPAHTNVYHSLRFEEGDYYLKVQNQTARTDDMRIKLQDYNGEHTAVFNIKASPGSGEVIVPFSIPSFGEYYIAIDKPSGVPDFTEFEIHSGTPNPAAGQNFTPDNGTYGGETVTETLVYNHEFKTDESYPFYNMLPDGYTPVFEDNVMKMPWPEGSSWYQFFVGDLISTTVGKDYKVTIKIKASEAGTINANMGWGWDEGQIGYNRINVSTDWSEATATYNNIGGTSCNVVLQPGNGTSFRGNLEIEWIKVQTAVVAPPRQVP